MKLYLFYLLCFIFIQVESLPVKKIRKFYIAAEEEVWDYAPQHWDHYRNQSLDRAPSSLYTVYRKNRRIGAEYLKAFYRQYDDSTFERQIPHDPQLGILGPILRVEGGDQIQLEFLNRARYPFSLHPHHSTRVRTVQPGERYTYVWDIPETNEVLVWAYSSRTDPIADLNAGLLGLIVIYPGQTLRFASPGSTFEGPTGVDQEVFTLMTNTDENRSRYFEASAERRGIMPARLEELRRTDEDFEQSNRMYHINGYVYNNNRPIELVLGSRVRWFVVSFDLAGQDVHTAHWHGATVLSAGHRVDVLDMLPVSFEVVEMVPDNPGLWLFHCHVASHFDGGMTTFYQIDEVIYTGDEGWEKN